MRTFSAAIVLMFLFIFSSISCNKSAVKSKELAADTSKYQYFGEKINEQNVLPLEDVLNKMQQESLTELEAKVSGTVLEVCQVKGCWMTLETPDEGEMRVTFKDYGFFMPKDIADKTVVIEGTAELVTTSVEDLKHYAEDAGQTQEEIDQITEPEKEITFEAFGVIIK